MIPDDFWLDGVNALDSGIRCQKEITFEAAEPDMENLKIPGRSGDLLDWDGSYKNVAGKAECYCLSADVSRVTAAINEWLMRRTEYRRLETLHEDGFFRLARLKHGARHEARKGLLNPFTLDFDCRPEKFYKSGDHALHLTAATTLVNPSAFPAKPLITVHGSGAGTLTVNGYTLTLTDCNEITLDSEEEEATRSGQSVNSLVGGDYPILGKTNAVSWTGGITGISIKARWWTL